jgi:hypothetical protein
VDYRAPGVAMGAAAAAAQPPRRQPWSVRPSDSGRKRRSGSAGGLCVLQTSCEAASRWPTGASGLCDDQSKLGTVQLQPSGAAAASLTRRTCSEKRQRASTNSDGRCA